MAVCFGQSLNAITIVRDLNGVRYFWLMSVEYSGRWSKKQLRLMNDIAY
jgi:hypothetical protein